MIERFDPDVPKPGNVCYERFRAHHQGLYEWAAEFLASTGRRDWHIIDAASGNGHGYDYLSRFGDYTGLDISAEAVRAAKAKRPFAIYIQCDLEAGPLGSEVVVCFETAEHLVRPDRFLRRMECKYLLFSAPTSLTRHFDQYHLRDWSKYQWRAALRRAGFHVLKEREMDVAKCSFAQFCRTTPLKWSDLIRIAGFMLGHPRYFWDAFWVWGVGQRFRWTSHFFVCVKGTSRDLSRLGW